MSAIFGLVQFDGRPVDVGKLERMRAQLARWGPDGQRVWRDGAAGLGRMLLCSTPEALGDAMPVWDGERQIAVVAAGRLDNRDELGAEFGLDAVERVAAPDSRLIQLAYERWGEECPGHLLGDWCLAVWRPQARRLFLARDQLGMTALFYFHRPPLIAFASGADALLALPGVPREIDEHLLARYLAGVLDPETVSHTFWKDIRLLLPGRSLVVTAESAVPRHYWRIENAKDLHHRRPEDTVAEFLEHFRRAVRLRLRSVKPIGSTLSAGLDSGSVTALGAEALKGQGQRLTAFTSVPIHAADHLVGGALADEWPLAHAVARHWDNIDHVALRAENPSPVAALEQSLGISPMPVHAASNLYWLLALGAQARDRGIGVVLTGQMGNATVSWTGGTHRILHSFARGRWREGARALAARCGRTGRSWPSAIKAELLAPVLRPLRHRACWRGHLDPQWWLRWGAIAPDLVGRAGLVATIRAHPTWNTHHVPGWPLAPARELADFFSLVTPWIGAVYHPLGAAFGIEFRDPTADLRLAEFCAGVEGEVFEGRRGDRLLVRQGMKGLLPDEVRWNIRRGVQGADLAYRLLSARREVETAIMAVGRVQGVERWLELGVLEESWRAVQTAVTHESSERAKMILMRGLLVGALVGRADGGSLWS